jgi:hypothetical protein
MGQRRVLLAIAVLLAAIALAVSGCVGSERKSEPAGTDADETAPAEAQDAIVKGIEAMFTWFPARDSSPMDAYNRALPFLGPAFRDGANNTLERGNSVWWQEWKDEKAEVNADALLVAAEHPADTPDTVQRAVLVTQTVKAADGKELDKSSMRIERVVAKKDPEGWRVQEINFFPENEYRTQTCPPGQSHQPAPDGPCVPNPPPPPKQCPDGSTVAPDQVCPPAPTGPQTKQCPDGTAIPAGATCPGTGPTTPQPPQTKQCPDGKSIPADQTCPATTGPTPTQCPDGSTVPAGQQCPAPPTQCPDGSTVPAGQQCPTPPTQCPDGTTVPAGQQCPTPPTQCPDGTTVPPGQQCPTPKPTQCLDGTTVPAGQSCPIRIPCPDGSTVPLGKFCPPVECPDGSTATPPLPCPIPIPCRDGSTVYFPQTCPTPIRCPDGDTVYSPQTCPDPKPTSCEEGQIFNPDTKQCEKPVVILGPPPAGDPDRSPDLVPNMCALNKNLCVHHDHPPLR